MLYFHIFSPLLRTKELLHQISNPMFFKLPLSFSKDLLTSLLSLFTVQFFEVQYRLFILQVLTFTLLLCSGLKLLTTVTPQKFCFSSFYKLISYKFFVRSCIIGPMFYLFLLFLKNCSVMPFRIKHNFWTPKQSNSVRIGVWVLSRVWYNTVYRIFWKLNFKF